MTYSSLSRLRFIVVLLHLTTAILSGSVMASTPSEAEDSTYADTSAIQQLHDIKVIGHRRPLATVQALSGKELQALSSNSIADALKYFAGTQIKDYGGIGGVKTLNVRSLGAQHVGVYIDGVRLNNAQNGTVDLGKYSLSTLESVSLYNANKLDQCQSPSEYASAATVYLRTAQPRQDSLTVLGGIGSFHTYRGRVNARLVRNDWKAFVDGEYLNSRGDYKFRYKSEYEDTVGRRRNSDIEYYRIEAGVFNRDFSSHIYLYQSERGCPGGIVRRLSDRYTNIGREWDTDMFAQASFDHSFNRHHRLKVVAKYSHEYLRYCTDYPDNQNTAKVDNHYWTNDGYMSAAYNWSPWTWLSVNTGYDARISWMDADLKKFSVVRRLDQKAVIAASGRFRDLRLAASMLYQHFRDHTKFNAGAAEPISRFTPAVTLAYDIKGVSLRTWYKKIFRVPTLNDLYYTQSGNRSLQPEYTRQWDIGAEYHFNATNWIANAQADFYINHVDNRIVSMPLRGTYTWTMLNYGATRCHGLNTTVSAHYFVNDWTMSLLNTMTWQRDVNRTDPDDPDTYNRQICYSPTWSTSLTAMAAWRGYTASMSYMYVGERMWSYADPEDVLKPYNNIDLKVSGTWRQFTATLQISDLLDVQYEHIPRYPMPGRSFSFTLSFSL